MSIKVELLADHPKLFSVITNWLEGEWPSWYGPDAPGDAVKDLDRYGSRSSLPIGVVAFTDGQPCGFAVLKSEAITGYEQFSPWAGAAVVPNIFRNIGIGSQLIQALEMKGKEIGFGHIYAGTQDASNLFLRLGWRRLGVALHNGENVYVFEKTL